MITDKGGAVSLAPCLFHLSNRHCLTLGTNHVCIVYMSSTPSINITECCNKHMSSTSDGVFPWFAHCVLALSG